MILPIIFFSSNSLAGEQGNPANEYNSIYRYNALENKIYFSDTTNNVDILAKKLPGDTESIDNTAKELKDITEKQNSSIEKTENIIDTLENRSGLKTFMIGNSLGTLRFQLVQIKEHATLLEALALRSQYSSYMLQINNQFKIVKEEQLKVEDLILEHKDKFSLFGWFVKML